MANPMKANKTLLIMNLIAIVAVLGFTVYSFIASQKDAKAENGELNDPLTIEE